MKRRWLNVIGYLVGTACLISLAHADSLLGSDAFTERYVAKVRADKPDVEILSRGNLEVEIEVDGQSVSIGLDNAFRQYQSDPEGLERILHAHVATIGSWRAELDTDTTGSIRPVIKSDDYLAELRSMTIARGVSDDEFPLVYTKLADNLNVLYVLDTEYSMSMIDRKSADDMRLSEKGLRAIATENLMDFFAEIAISVESLETSDGGIVAYLVADGNYEASAILIDELIVALDDSLAGNLVVFVPARDLFIATGTDEPGGYDAAKEVSMNLFQESAYVISPHAYVIEDGDWVRYQR